VKLIKRKILNIVKRDQGWIMTFRGPWGNEIMGTTSDGTAL